MHRLHLNAASASTAFAAGYLAGRGLPRAHLGTTTRCEFDATGNDEGSWARDRKVDVTLVE